MKIILEVTSATDQSKRQITALFPDFIAFETKFDRAITKLNEGHVLSDLAWLGWHSEYRRKVTALEFEVWCNDIESFDSLEDGNTINP